MDGRSGGAVADVLFRGGLLCVSLLAGGCTPGSAPPPPTFTLTEFQPDDGRSGRTVAVSISSADPQTAIAAAESGGLFQTRDGGQSWAHQDAFPPFRMSDVSFAPPGFGSSSVVIATALADATANAQANQGGVWTSSDDGATWTHVVLPSQCGSSQVNAHGIAYSGTTVAYVATDCGLLVNAGVGGPNWSQSSNWRVVYPAPLVSVSAQSAGTSTIIDVCAIGRGHDRSVDGGATWRGVRPGPDCQSPHSIAASPLESDVLFGTRGGTVVESDDGGATWPIDLQASSTSGRPKFVATHRAADQDATHFDLYFSGRQVTCFDTGQGTTRQRCPTNTNDSWAYIPNVPGTNLNHDINGIAMSPGPDNCAVYQAFDFGVLRKGPPLPGLPCGSPAAWTLPGRSGAGLGALQIYQVAGQVQYPVTGGGVSISGHTKLALGTMDNMNWFIRDASISGWQAVGTEGSFLQALNDTALAAQPDLAFTFVDFGSGGFLAKKIIPNTTTGAWSAVQPWTSVTPPGNASPPFLVSSGTYVQWSGTTLFLSLDSGASWTPVGTLPAGFTTFNGIQVTQTTAGPAVFEMVADATPPPNQKQGIALLTRFLPPPATPKPFEIRTLGGTNNRGLSSGLKAIWGHCFGQGAWYCAPIYAADPRDYRRLFAVDSVDKVVVVSTDAAQTWKVDWKLTNLVTAGGVSMTDSIGTSQIHVFAFDPNNSARILVGTDHAGIFASANGGQTWSALPGTARATAITSFFFDNRTNTIYVGTYGRGLWRLVLDWTTVS